MKLFINNQFNIKCLNLDFKLIIIPLLPKSIENILITEIFNN